MTSLLSPPVVRRGLFLGWVVLLILIALLPGAEGSIRTSDPFFCLFCGSRGTGDAILNVVFFMPFGFLLAPGRSVRRIAALGLAVSVSIEFVQELLPGRYPTFGDVVWNVTGASLGAFVSHLLRKELGEARAAPSPWVASAAVVLPLVYLLGAGLLLQPIPTDARYFGQWMPDLDFMPLYGGDVLQVQSQRGLVPNGPIADSVDLRMEDPWFLRARILKGPPPTGPSPVASIYDGEEREIALLGAHREDLVWRERTRAAALRFDILDRRFVDALGPYTTGDTVWIEARGEGRERCLRVDAREDCGGGVTPGRTWGLLLFLQGPVEGTRRIIDVAWMATLAVLLGILGGSPRRTALLSLVVVGGVAVLVVATRLIAPPAVEWAGFGGGILFGVALRPFLRWVVEGTPGNAVPVPEERKVRIDPSETELP